MLSKISHLSFFREGHRGVISVGFYRGNKVVVKALHPSSRAIGRIANEAYWLSFLRPYAIGPRLILSNSEHIVEEFLDGPFFIDWAACARRSYLLRAVLDILSQCRRLDVLRLNKFEMHRPYRNVIMRRGKPVLIDFERCKRTLHPKNVTQFCQFLFSRKFSFLLSQKEVFLDFSTLRRLAASYKVSYSPIYSRRIMLLLKEAF